MASAYGESSTPLERTIEQKLREGQVSDLGGDKILLKGYLEELQEMRNRFTDVKVLTKLTVTDPGRGYLNVMPSGLARVKEMIDKARARNTREGHSSPPISR